MQSRYPEDVIRNIDFEHYQMKQSVYKKGDYDHTIYIAYSGEFALEMRSLELFDKKNNGLFTKSALLTNKSKHKLERKTSTDLMNRTVAIIPQYETIGEYETLNNLPRSLTLKCKSANGE